MTPVIFLLALIIILGVLLLLAPIWAEYRYRTLQQSSQTSSSLDKLTIAAGYRYVCWLTGTAMIAAAIVLLFRLGW
ncbi:MAG: hypothetical protein KME35_01450 [Aphanocapsa sp. GSE-SYN-MK-11-07L]|jgi:hypothetical protein|nr:hypothetical protein [Aphanocapsa sp. GSE-SYN-MK-11-07L]